MIALTACGSTAKHDPESAGVRQRAVEQLRAFGLPDRQAECVVDKMGAETVAAASEMNILAAGQEYQDAVKGCPP